MVCVQISSLFPGFPESEAEFLTFRREDFFAAGVSRVSRRDFSLIAGKSGIFFVSLYQHHGDFLPPGFEKRSYPTFRMIPGIV